MAGRPIDRQSALIEATCLAFISEPALLSYLTDLSGCDACLADRGHDPGVTEVTAQTLVTAGAFLQRGFLISASAP